MIVKESDTLAKQVLDGGMTQEQYRWSTGVLFGLKTALNLLEEASDEPYGRGRTPDTEKEGLYE